MTLAGIYSGRLSEHQVVGDLVNLFRRHKVTCGEPQDLERLAGHLTANPALCSDLFTLCTAISHMAADDLSPEQLLHLVARAVGGASISGGNAVDASIPPAVSSVFLANYEVWTRRHSEFDFVSPSPRQPERLNDLPAEMPGDQPLPNPGEAPSIPLSHLAPPPETVTISETSGPAEEKPPVAHTPIETADAAPSLSPAKPVPIRFSAYPETGDPRVRRLRTMVAILIVSLVATNAITAALVYRYVSRRHADNPDSARVVVVPQAPVGKPAVQPAAAELVPPTPPPATSVGDPLPAVNRSRETPATGPSTKPAAASPTRTIIVPSTTIMTYALSAPQPVFPKTRLIGPDSTIDVEATISKEGRVTSARVLRGDMDMAPAAVSAIRSWRFRPYLVEGDAVEVIVGFTFRFSPQ